MELRENTVVAERFRLVRMLGEGGMGSVWLARHVRLDTLCAVKFIHADVAGAASLRERFDREAKIAAQLKSPHVVGVLDYGVWSGAQYLAMEYLEGEDLAQRLDKRGRLTPMETSAVVTQVARALTKAHAAGLVHRDLKPENVFLVKDDEGEIAKVLDFGIAKAQTPLTSAQTQTGALLGTPRFMSPEQAEGKKTVDHRTDLWALGVIAYRCLVGHLPFDSEALGDLLLRIMVHPLPVPSRFAPDLPPSFDAWWAKAAARDPDQRFQSAKELADALASSLAVASPPRVSSPSMDPMSAPNTTPNFAPPSMPNASSSPSAPVRVITAPDAAMYGATMQQAATVNTMNPASRTFSGDAKKKTSAAPFVAVGALLVVGVVVAGVLALRKTTDGVATSESSAPSVTATPATTAPIVAPQTTIAPVSTEAPAVTTPPSTTPVATTPPVNTAPHQVARPQPAVTTPRPARTGKVHIGPPG